MTAPGAAAAHPVLSSGELRAPPPGSGWVASAARYECKYRLAAARAESLRVHLAARARPDREHPENRVHTLYFDTPRLRTRGDKIDGDYVKRKLRLRWYAAGPGEAPARRAWLEVKAKAGSRGGKWRLELDWTPPADAASLGHAALVDLEGLVRERGGHDLRPSCWLSYRRHRWVWPADASRIALDREIRIEWSASWIPKRRPDPLPPLAIVEWKGSLPTPGPSLVRLFGRRARREAISKYSLCLDHLQGERT